MCKVSKTELLDLITAAINRQTDLLTDIAGSDNSQVKSIELRTIGSKNALQDVKAALQGNPVYLKVLAGK